MATTTTGNLAEVKEVKIAIPNKKRILIRNYVLFLIIPFVFLSAAIIKNETVMMFFSNSNSWIMYVIVAIFAFGFFLHLVDFLDLVLNIDLEKDLEQGKEKISISGMLFPITKAQARTKLMRIVILKMDSIRKSNDRKGLTDHDIDSLREDYFGISGYIQKTCAALPGFGLLGTVLGLMSSFGSIATKSDMLHVVAPCMTTTFLGMFCAIILGAFNYYSISNKKIVFPSVIDFADRNIFPGGAK